MQAIPDKLVRELSWIKDSLNECTTNEWGEAQEVDSSQESKWQLNNQNHETEENLSVQIPGLGVIQVVGVDSSQIEDSLDYIGQVILQICIFKYQEIYSIIGVYIARIGGNKKSLRRTFMIMK